MNKLLLNQSARNHIKMLPLLDDFSIPSDEGEKIKWCENVYKQLQRDNNAKRLCLYKNRSKGYLIAVWRSNDTYYLIQCIRNEFKTYNDTFYITKNGDDAIAIAKFLKENVDEILRGLTADLIKAWKLIDECKREKHTK